MVLGKKVASFDWEWGRNSAPRDGQKMPWQNTFNNHRIGNATGRNVAFCHNVRKSKFP